MDEYTSEIFMGGKSTIVLHNTCEDSLLAAPIILDLVLLAELSTRIQLKAEGEVCFLLHPYGTLLLWFLPSHGMIQTMFNFAGQVSFLPPSCHHPQLPHQGPSGKSLYMHFKALNLVGSPYSILPFNR